MKETFTITVLLESGVKRSIKTCKTKGHFQQVVYSVAGNALTQICFGCKTIRTSFRGRK